MKIQQTDPAKRDFAELLLGWYETQTKAAKKEGKKCAIRVQNDDPNEERL